MANETPNKVLQRYLEDVIAAEKSFESQLRAMAKEGDFEPAKALFAEHADQTQTQHERLSARLEQLGGSPSALKTAAAHVFNFTPKVAQLGHSSAEKSSQDLIIAFTVKIAKWPHMKRWRQSRRRQEIPRPNSLPGRSRKRSGGLRTTSGI